MSVEATVQVQKDDDGRLRIELAGPLSATSTGALWKTIDAQMQGEAPGRVEINVSGVDYCDLTGVGLLLDIRRRVEPLGGSVEIRGFAEEFQPLLGLFQMDRYLEDKKGKAETSHLAEDVGRGTMQALKDLRSYVSFTGEMTVALLHALRRPRSVRWIDAVRTAETAGVNALPIVMLIGFLMGLIMAFQAAIPMRQFGADIFVANLVALSMLRELGPLMTAIVLAGRSGSAFAAEIGTMKVNEEVNALVTMSLDPVRFLIVPRVIAAVLMTPVLTVFANLAGLIGGLVVMLSLGFPFITYYNQVVASTGVTDLTSGLVKAFFFGILVAAVGCLRGLNTKTGASAVGDSTTSAVVSSIVLIAVTDGIFSVIYYALGI